ncbi:hypothetical protein NN561_008951 [Cricetulus griseus]
MNVDTKGPRKHKDEGGIEKHRAQIVSGGRRDVPAWWGEGGVGSTVPEQRRDPGPARVRSPRVGLRRGPGEGRVWSARPSPVLARNPTRWASRKESDQGLGPKAKVCGAAPGGAAAGNKTRRGRPAAFAISALTPRHSLRHTTLFSPRSVTGGAIFPKPWSRSHRLPLATYLGPETCAPGWALPLGGEGSAPSADRALW